jgi:hypothetical protein
MMIESKLLAGSAALPSGVGEDGHDGGDFGQPGSKPGKRIGAAGGYNEDNSGKLPPHGQVSLVTSSDILLVASQAML